MKAELTLKLANLEIKWFEKFSEIELIADRARGRFQRALSTTRKRREVESLKD
jgi:hypothetical protein